MNYEWVVSKSRAQRTSLQNLIRFEFAASTFLSRCKSKIIELTWVWLNYHFYFLVTVSGAVVVFCRLMLILVIVGNLRKSAFAEDICRGVGTWRTSLNISKNYEVEKVSGIKNYSVNTHVLALLYMITLLKEPFRFTYKWVNRALFNFVAWYWSYKWIKKL